MGTLYQTLQTIEGHNSQPKPSDVREAKRLIMYHYIKDAKVLEEVHELSVLLNKYGVELKAAHDLMSRIDYLTSPNSAALRKTAGDHLRSALNNLAKAKRLLSGFVNSDVMKLE